MSSVEFSVQSLVALHPDGLVPKLVDIFIQKLDRGEIHITENDYEIFKTPGNDYILLISVCDTVGIRKPDTVGI